MEVNDANGNSIAYILHIKKLYEEHEQLQLEYSRLRQQMNDNVILPKNDGHFSNENNNRTMDDLRTDLECEKSLTKSLRIEITYLLDQVRKNQKRYYDLISIIKNGKEKTAGAELNGERKCELNLRMSQLENENRDLKENIEFVTSENAVLTDSLKDLEETHFQERREWLKEKEKYEEVVVWSRNIYETSKTNKTNIETMEKQINAFDGFLNFIQNLIIENNPSSKEELKNCEQEEKLKVYEKIIQAHLFTSKKLTKDAAESNSDCNTNAKIIELCKQIEALQTSNKCLLSENDELKSITSQNKNINFDHVKLKLEIANLNAKLSEHDTKHEQLIQKYYRNRKVWEENEQTLTEEIGKLDNFIGVLIDTLHKLPDNLRNSSELQEILALIDQNEIDKSTNKL